MALSVALKNILQNLLKGIGNAEEFISVVDSATAVLGSATAADLTKLHALTATATELNRDAGVTAGTISASKTVVADANTNIGAVKASSLAIGASGSETTFNPTQQSVVSGSDINNLTNTPAAITGL